MSFSEDARIAKTYIAVKKEVSNGNEYIGGKFMFYGLLLARNHNCLLHLKFVP